MKKLSTLSKSIIITLGIAGVGTAAIAVGQNDTTNNGAMAAVQSKISLEQAINIAQKMLKGDLVSAEFDQNDYSTDGKYEIKTITNNTEYEIEIDANTGKVLSTEQEQLDQDDIAEYSAMRQAKVSLIQAMQTATQSVNGKVIEAEFDMDSGKSVYEIEVAKGNQVYKVIIDSMTAKVVSSGLDADN